MRNGLRSVSSQPVFVLEVFVFLVLFLLAVKAELLAGGTAVLAEALPTCLACKEGLCLHAANEALRHTFTSLFRMHGDIINYRASQALQRRLMSMGEGDVICQSFVNWLI